MKRNMRPWSVAAISLGLLLAGCAGSGGGGAESGDLDEIELVYASFIPEDDPNSVTAKRWMEEVTEATDGKVTFETNFGGSLCEGPEMLSCVQNGRADMGSMSLAYFPSELPLLGLASVPFQTSNLDAAIHATYSYAKGESEVKDELTEAKQHLLYVGPAAPPILGTTEPVESLSDIEGRSIRALGVLGKSVKDLGWGPVDISANELYEAMQRGTIEGALFPVNGMVGYRLIENTDYYYDMGRYIGVNDNTLTMMNDDTWRSLTPDLQDAITSVSEKIIDDSIATDWVPLAERDCDELLEATKSFEEMPDAEELEAWSDDQLAKQIDLWSSNVERRTDDADSLVSAYQGLIDQFESPDAPPSPADVCLQKAAS